MYGLTVSNRLLLTACPSWVAKAFVSTVAQTGRWRHFLSHNHTVTSLTLKSAVPSGTLMVLKYPYPWRVEEPSIYESVRVHTAVQTGRTESDLVADAPSVSSHSLTHSLTQWITHLLTHSVNHTERITSRFLQFLILSVCLKRGTKTTVKKLGQTVWESLVQNPVSLAKLITVANVNITLAICQAKHFFLDYSWERRKATWWSKEDWWRWDNQDWIMEQVHLRTSVEEKYYTFYTYSTVQKTILYLRFDDVIKPHRNTTASDASKKRIQWFSLACC